MGCVRPRWAIWSVWPCCLILLTGLQRRPWAIWVNLGAQPVLVAGFAVYPGVGFIGVLFAALWVLIAYLRAEVRRRRDYRVSQ